MQAEGVVVTGKAAGGAVFGVEAADAEQDVVFAAEKGVFAVHRGGEAVGGAFFARIGFEQVDLAGVVVGFHRRVALAVVYGVARPVVFELGFPVGRKAVAYFGEHVAAAVFVGCAFGRIVGVAADFVWGCTR